MFNEKRIEEIRKNIQISTILSDHEKNDWLNLLELMNDKQLGELEEILGVMPTMSAIPAQQRPQIEQDVSAPIKMPPLSHIANIPTDVTMIHTVPGALNSTPALKPTPPPAPAKVVSDKILPKSVVPPASVPQHSKTSIKSPVVPKPAAPSQLNKLAIQNISDIEAFKVSTLRKYDLQSVVDSMREIIQTNGYFQILQQFEASPLYRSYIETGKFMLGHGTAKVTDPETTLSQAEFEFITDLLRHMRFNTW